MIHIAADASLHSPWDQRLALYFSNPRAVSLLVTPRASKYGSRRLVYEPRTDAKVQTEAAEQLFAAGDFKLD
jgi:hypothetical protein